MAQLAWAKSASMRGTREFSEELEPNCCAAFVLRDVSRSAPGKVDGLAELLSSGKPSSKARARTFKSNAEGERDAPRFAAGTEPVGEARELFIPQPALSTLPSFLSSSRERYRGNPKHLGMRASSGDPTFSSGRRAQG